MQTPVKTSPLTNQHPAFYSWMLFLSLNQQCRSTEGKIQVTQMFKKLFKTVVSTWTIDTLSHWWMCSVVWAAVYGRLLQCSVVWAAVYGRLLQCSVMEFCCGSMWMNVAVWRTEPTAFMRRLFSLLKVLLSLTVQTSLYLMFLIVHPSILLHYC